MPKLEIDCCFAEPARPPLAAEVTAALARWEIVLQPACGRGGTCLLFCGSPGERLERLLAEQRDRGRERVLVLLQEPPESLQVWRLLAAGATDVVVWGGSERSAEPLAARLLRWAEIDALTELAVVRKGLIGNSPKWRAVVRRLVEIARFSDSAVLITGETGTGKELAARLVHTLDPRHEKKDLVLLDCTTIAPELGGSEFFGHERGAFTNAVAARDGAFALADAGTLFLDEIGELPARLQAELLRVVQEGTFKRLGANIWQQTRFRLVGATHRDLPKEVAEGRFRQDLYHRITAWECRLPPLAERRSDVPLLALHFLRERLGRAEVAIDPVVLDLLMNREYPGNVRELRQLVGRIAQRHVGPGPITVGDVPEQDWPCPATVPEPAPEEGFETVIARALAGGMGLKAITNTAAEVAIRLAIGEAAGNLRRAAERLGVTDRALHLRRANGRRSPRE